MQVKSFFKIIHKVGIKARLKSDQKLWGNIKVYENDEDWRNYSAVKVFPSLIGFANYDPITHASHNHVELQFSGLNHFSGI